MLTVWVLLFHNTAYGEHTTSIKGVFSKKKKANDVEDQLRIKPWANSGFFTKEEYEVDQLPDELRFVSSDDIEVSYDRGDVD